MEFSQGDDNQNYSLSKFESMLKTNSVLFFDSNEFENIIHHYLENGKIALAKKAIKLGLEQHPSSVNLQLFLIEIYVIENKFDEANQLLDKLYDMEPSNEEIYIQKANVLSKQDEHKKAITSLEIALDISKTPENDSDLYSLIGMEYLFLDQFDKARESFEKCLKLDHTDYSALYNIIYCFDFMDKNKDAIDFLSHYLDDNPYCEVAWHQLGKQYFAMKSYKKALAAFDFAIISDDSFIGAYLEKGKVLEKQKRYLEAIENYKITLALDEPTSFALLRMGYCFEKLGENDTALQFFTKTVHEDPLLDKGWIAITKFYSKKKNYQKALYFINKAINIDSENVVYWKLYGHINHQLSFYEEAEHGYKRTLELGNYEIDTWLCRADILIKLGEFEASTQTLLQAAEFYPENEEVEYRLAGLYFMQNESTKGRYHLKNATKINRDYYFIIEELFPSLANHGILTQNLIATKKASN
ncbi:tetratricopeptide repeat protein [Ichthyenterobacterium sp. W332]|uniref:Tetratricopeptide repeat protein n=1 Tax=Microcosmobacter mediterraneus TaxID=3075607 RepID=A0ABU2YN74_9FLAO|nr:tetratricopeptide repeat protein [Ichthyenterobacterium sp. W332]MDT0559497.1 tetratricopeptide repeat protein [Ichthyenterobacterium sp. W332]